MEFQPVSANAYSVDRDHHRPIFYRETDAEHGFVEIALCDCFCEARELSDVVIVVQQDLRFCIRICRRLVVIEEIHAFGARDLIGSGLPQPHVIFHGLLLQVRHEASASGIINDDEEIVYVLLKEDSKIEYIHGVSIYDYDKTDKNTEEKEAVSTDYEYTKNIDSTFRAIFFDIKDINAKKGKNVYTFEMKFSFYDSDEIYTYLYPVSFTSEPNSDIADLIFDHSEEETTLPSENNQQNEDEKTTKAQKTTKLSKGDYSFIYNFYWYTEPVQNGDEYSISALKLNRDNTYVSTSYFKNGDSSWQITTSNGKYKIENGFVVIDNGEATESTYYKIDTDNNSLFEEENGKKAATLSSRKYNSIKNAEDFFGI